MRLYLVLVVGLIGLVGCNRTYITTSPSANSSTDAPKIITSKIEFRVTGNAQSIKVRYSNERDGLIQTVTTLPFFTSFSSTSDTLFLSLEVTPLLFLGNTDGPFVNAQIFVNGDLFREASSTSSFLNTISVNGTWRR